MVNTFFNQNILVESTPSLLFLQIFFADHHYQQKILKAFGLSIICSNPTNTQRTIMT